MKWNRIDFFKNTIAATLAAMAVGSMTVSPLPASQEQIYKGGFRLYLEAGGMAHTDTFDPQDTHVYEGMEQ